MTLRPERSTALSRACALALLLLWAALQVAGAETLLEPHTAEYKVKISVLGGQLNTELRHTGSGYIATHEVRATGMSRLLSGGHIRDSSEFVPTADGVRPVRFVSEDTITGDDEDAVIEFDWEAGEARGLVNNSSFRAELQDVAFDRVSIQYELMHDLLNGGEDERYVLFDIDGLKTVEVSRIGARNVSVPAGKYRAVGVQHQVIGSKRITTMWCVEELGYLPVIIEQHRKGKLRMRAILQEYTPISAT